MANILILERDVLFANWISVCARASGHAIKIVHDVALLHAEYQRPDVLIADWGFFEATGVQSKMRRLGIYTRRTMLLIEPASASMAIPGCASALVRDGRNPVLPTELAIAIDAALQSRIASVENRERYLRRGRRSHTVCV